PSGPASVGGPSFAAASSAPSLVAPSRRPSSGAPSGCTEPPSCSAASLPPSWSGALPSRPPSLAGSVDEPPQPPENASASAEVERRPIGQPGRATALLISATIAVPRGELYIQQMPSRHAEAQE